jgi:hypothetical protein
MLNLDSAQMQSATQCAKRNIPCNQPHTDHHHLAYTCPTNTPACWPPPSPSHCSPLVLTAPIANGEGHQAAGVAPVGLEGHLAVPLDVVAVGVGGAAQLRVAVPEQQQRQIYRNSAKLLEG